MPAITPVTLDDYRDLIQSKVKDIPAHLVANEIDASILEAVKEHSRFRTLTRSVDYTVPNDGTGSGSKYIAINTTNFPQYADGFSRFIEIDTTAKALVGGNPAVTDPSFLEIAKDILYMNIAGAGAPLNRYMYFPWITPNLGDLWRFTYTVQHTIQGLDTATLTTVYPIDAERFANLASHYICIHLANFYRQSADMERFNADIINYSNKSDQYMTAARTFRAMYDNSMGIVGEPPSNIHTDYDEAFQWDRPFLTHRFRGSR